MGKQRRQRKKYHQPSKSTKEAPSTEEAPMETQPIVFSPTSNLFAGLDINIDNLKKNLSDSCSVKSFKSDLGNRLLKKDKTKLRRKMLLEKLDATVKAKKKKKTKITDSSPLKDALPSLQFLMKEKVDAKLTKPKPKRKGTPKAAKQKRHFLNNVDAFKRLLQNKEFKANPQKIVSDHIAKVVERGKRHK